jgi:hypothetical protein
MSIGYSFGHQSGLFPPMAHQREPMEAAGTGGNLLALRRSVCQLVGCAAGSPWWSERSASVWPGEATSTASMGGGADDRSVMVSIHRLR